MITEIYNDAEASMQKTVEALKKDYASLRAGRAAPSLLDKVTVDYYGTATPLNQLGNITAPEPRLLVIQPWDKSAIGAIEKAILKSDLGLMPANDGNVIRLPIPVLTEERRKELVKVVKKKAEESKVACRNVRRDANELLKKFQKSSEITEDELRKGQDDVQKLTDKLIKDIETVMDQKEEEIMQV